MRVLFASAVLLAASAQATTIHDLEKDRQAILSQAGCYAVNFQYAETFPLQRGYELQPGYSLGGVEWVEPIAVTGQQIDLQHVLDIGGGMAIKHWRQKWDLVPDQGADLFEYGVAEDNQGYWQKHSVEASDFGIWIQRVYQVDDSPRYECAAQWVHPVGAGSYWECRADAPLPRREKKRRSDYNVMDRRNRHQLTTDGWVHEQDNIKTDVQAGERRQLVLEKGLNTYRKIPDVHCAGARAWWEANQRVWTVIQAAWDEVYASEQQLAFRDDLDGKGTNLWQALFALARQYEASPDADMAALQAEAAATIQQYTLP